MNTLFWSALLGIGLVEKLALAFRLNYWRRRATAVENAALTFAETPDEIAQERLIVRAAWNLMGLVLYVSAILLLLLLFFSVLPDFIALDGDAFIWTTSAAAIVYVWLRPRLHKHFLQPKTAAESPDTPAMTGYNRIARWLHWMALELQLVRATSFELEKALYLKKANRYPGIQDQPVYVMGLARSGTTVTLEILEKTGAFHSPTYRDMPFVLCPNLWKSLTQHSRLKGQMTTRAHGDGLVVGFDSPESFEEVFWRTACKAQPGPAYSLAEPTADVLADFAAYRSLNILSGLTAGKRPDTPTTAGLRYLSKNNNNIIRLEQLIAQSNARLVLIIRDPLATAWSLYRQHQRFSQMQADDLFVRAYMRWLGHHEFGHGHRPLDTGTQHLDGLTPDQADYWLAYWLGMYENLWQTYLALPGESQTRIIWMLHEHMCQSPAQELTRLFKFGQIEQSVDKYTAVLKTPAAIADLELHFRNDLIERSKALYSRILKTIPT